MDFMEMMRRIIQMQDINPKYIEREITAAVSTVD